MTKLSGPRRKGIPLTIHEIRKLRNVCYTLSERAMLELMIQTGIRRGDLVSLTWENVDFDQGILRFYQAKSDKPVRAILSSQLLNILRELRKFRSRTKAPERIFPIKPETVYARCQSWRSRANLKRELMPHDFCHTATQFMSDAKVPITVAESQTGRTKETINRHYLHAVSLTKQRKELESFWELLT